MSKVTTKCKEWGATYCFTWTTASKHAAHYAVPDGVDYRQFSPLSCQRLRQTSTSWERRTATPGQQPPNLQLILLCQSESFIYNLTLLHVKGYDKMQEVGNDVLLHRDNSFKRAAHFTVQDGANYRQFKRFVCQRLRQNARSGERRTGSPG